MEDAQSRRKLSEGARLLTLGSRMQTVDLAALAKTAERAIVIRVAGCAVKILFDASWSVQVFELCQEYWRAFLVEETVTELEIVLVPAAGGFASLNAEVWHLPQPFQYALEDATGDWTLHRDFTSVRRGSRVHAWLPQPQDGYFDALDNILSISLRALAEKRSAFLFHSAVVEHQGEAVVFFGPSGIGKSTLAKLSCDQQLRVMASDQVYLRIEKEDLWASASPTCNPDIPRDDKVWVTSPLRVKALFALQRNVSAKQGLVISEISKAEMTRRFLAEIFQDETEVNAGPVIGEGLDLAFKFACQLQGLSVIKNMSLSYPLHFNFWPSLEKIGYI